MNGGSTEGGRGGRRPERDARWGRDRPGTEESRADNVKVFCDYFNGQRDENGGT